MTSLLRDAGHTDPDLYPLGRLYLEHDLAVRRRNNDIAQNASLMFLAISAVLSEEAAKSLQGAIKALTK